MITRLGSRKRRVDPADADASPQPDGQAGRRTGPSPASRAGGLLASKLVVPVPTWLPVPRPRLHALLDQGTHGPLTLLAAPPGAGKTMLVASWAAGRHAPGPVAWVTADPGDADPDRFWAHVLAALQATGALPARGVLSGLRGLPGGADDRFLAVLVNGLAELRSPVVLVVDDLHEAGGRAVPAGLQFLLRHGPPQLRLVIASRADVAVSLHRLRLAGQLTEIRAADLAFTPAEADELLAGLGVSLLEADLERLWRRTEGWAAGLRLAALSLRGHPDPGRFVAEFAGDDHAVAGYLVEEVLACQPPEVQEFLLRTCMADRLSGELADALTGRSDGARMLARLERSHAFTTALGPNRLWYQYHPLFAELLRAELRHWRTEEVPGLHRRAADWLAANDLLAEAAGHALAGGDLDQAARVLEAHWQAILARPRAPAGRDLARLAPAGHGWRPEPGPGDQGRRALVLTTLGAAELWSEELDGAHAHLEEGTTLAQQAGEDAVALTALGHLALLEAIDGNLTRAERLGEAAAGLAERHGWSERPQAAAAELARAWVRYQRDDLPAAARILGRAASAARLGRDRNVALAVELTEVRLAAGGGRDGLSHALVDLRAALLATAGHGPPRLLAGVLRRSEARLLLAAGDHEAAAGVLPADPGADLAAPDAVIAARVRLAGADPAGAARILAPHLDGRVPGPRLPVLVEACMVDALARHELGDHGAAGDRLERTLGLAAPEGHRRVFVEGGPAVRALLTGHLRRDTAHRALLGSLLEALPPVGSPAGGPAGDPAAALVEPLSERERVVLRYLPSLLSAHEIASELYVSVNTVKSHIRSIYRKLDTNRRMDAVRRARQLELL